MASLFGFVSPSPVAKIPQVQAAPANNTVRVAGGWSMPVNMVSNPVEFLQAKQLAHGAKMTDLDMDKIRLSDLADANSKQEPLYDAPSRLYQALDLDEPEQSGDEEDSEDERIVDYPLVDALVPEFKTELPAFESIPTDSAEANMDDEASDDESDEENLSQDLRVNLSLEERARIAKNSPLSVYRSVQNDPDKEHTVGKFAKLGWQLDVRVNEVGRRRCLRAVSNKRNIRRLTISRPRPRVSDALDRQRHWELQNFRTVGVSNDQFVDLFSGESLRNWFVQAESILDSSLASNVWSNNVVDERVSRKLLALAYWRMDNPLFPNDKLESPAFLGPKEVCQVCASGKPSCFKVDGSQIGFGTSGLCNVSARYNASSSLSRSIKRHTIVGTVRGILVTLAQAEKLASMRDSEGNVLFPRYLERLIPFVRVPDSKFGVDGYITTFVDPDQLVLHYVVSLAKNKSNLPADIMDLFGDDPTSHLTLGNCVPFHPNPSMGNVHHRLFVHQGTVVMCVVANRNMLPGESLWIRRSNPRMTPDLLGGMDVSSLERQVMWDASTKEFVVKPRPDRTPV